MAKQPQANKPITKSPRGRPSSYTREVADEILRRIAEGESLKRIYASEGMPPMQTSLRWASDDIDGFRDRYTRAMQARAHQWAEEIVELADAAGPDDTQARRLQVDARKWVAAKFYPKVFGDRLQADVQNLDRNGDPTDPASINLMAAAMEKLSTDELRVLIQLYRRMGIRLPHEPAPVLEEAEDD